MITKAFRLLLLVAVMACVSCGGDDNGGGKEPGGGGNTGGGGEITKVHPLLFLKDSEIPALKTKINADEYWKEIHNNILAEGTKMISLPLLVREFDSANKRILGVSREAIRRIWFLSYAYRMSEEKRYANRAIAEMKNIAGFVDWNPSHFLDVGEMTVAMSIGYDWLYNIMSDTDKMLIREAILRKGLEPSLDTKYNGWLKGDNNWNQVCNGGMVLGALALKDFDPSLVTKYVDRANYAVKIPMALYKPDGGYPEGPGYWEYGTSFNVLHISAIDKALGSDAGLSAIPGFMTTGTYSQQVITSNLNSFCYADNGTGAPLSSTVMWFYTKTQDPALLYMQKRIFDKLRASQSYLKNDRILPAALIWGAGSGASLSKAQKPTSNFYLANGTTPICVMRTGWDAADMYVGVKAGKGATNHGHLDVGSFIIEANGERWAIDLGMESYANIEPSVPDFWSMVQTSGRWKVFRYNNLAHNTLSFDDQYQVAAGMVNFTKSQSTQTDMQCIMDLSPAYKDQVASAKRGIAMVDNKYVMIEDKVTTSTAARKMGWRMVVLSTDITLDDANNRIIVKKSGKSFFIKIDSPVAVTLKKWATTPAQSYENKNTGTTIVGFEAQLPASSNFDFKVYLMPTTEITTGLKGSFVN